MMSLISYFCHKYSASCHFKVASESPKQVIATAMVTSWPGEVGHFGEQELRDLTLNFPILHDFIGL